MSAANNGGPAFPTGEEHGFNSGEPGMTLRDYFAARAPEEIPRWFEFALATPAPEIPISTLTRDQYDEWDEIGAGEGSAPEIIAWDVQIRAARRAQAAWGQAFETARYFAWRWAYADAMIAERAK